MNPLPGIQKAIETIDKGLGKYADPKKREAAWALVRDVVEKWRPVPPKVVIEVPLAALHPAGGKNFTPFAQHIEPAGSEAKILADAASAECPASAEAIPEAVNVAVAQLVRDVTPYPTTASVKIQGMCPNPKLMAGTLEDGRRVSVWTSRGRQFRMYAEVPCKLDVVRGDEAIYLPT